MELSFKNMVLVIFKKIGVFLINEFDEDVTASIINTTRTSIGSSTKIACQKAKERNKD
jgi:hypothetical protein